MSTLSPDLNFPHFWSRLLLFDSAAILIKFGLYSMSVGQHWVDSLTQLIVSDNLEVDSGVYDQPSTIQVTTPESGFWSLGISLFSLRTWWSSLWLSSWFSWRYQLYCWQWWRVYGYQVLKISCCNLNLIRRLPSK